MIIIIYVHAGSRIFNNIFDYINVACLGSKKRHCNPTRIDFINKIRVSFKNPFNFTDILYVYSIFKCSIRIQFTPPYNNLYYCTMTQINILLFALFWQIKIQFFLHIKQICLLKKRRAPQGALKKTVPINGTALKSKILITP